jgi:hypothetical protein
MNASSLENMSVNISNGWIIGCSILTCGLLTCAYINGRSNMQLLLMKRKFKEEFKKLDKDINDLACVAKNNS